MKAPAPSNEFKRIENLHSFNILDTGPEIEFDQIVTLASFICETPISLVSLIDKDRQWFKAKKGLNVDETPRDVAFCGYAILDTTSPLIIEDATKDERFASNSLVTSDPNIRFYAGYPLTTNSGFALGTLCVIDTKPRKLTIDQIMALQVLAKNTVALLELKKITAEKTKMIESLEKSCEAYHALSMSTVKHCSWPLEQIQDHTIFIQDNPEHSDVELKLKLIQHQANEVSKCLNELKVKNAMKTCEG